MALEETSDKIISGVKADLDGHWLGSQSYFDKEEIIAKIGERHIELLQNVDIVSHRASITAQQGRDECTGVYITVGGGVTGSLGSVVSLLSSYEAITLVDESEGENSNSFIPQVLSGVFHQTLYFPRCH